jgi:hypothetical protein
MMAFVAKMGFTASYKVVVDWVSVTFKPQLIGSLEWLSEPAGSMQQSLLKHNGSSQHI